MCPISPGDVLFLDREKCVCTISCHDFRLTNFT